MGLGPVGRASQLEMAPGCYPGELRPCRFDSCSFRFGPLHLTKEET